MRTSDKQKFTYEAVERGIRELERELANMVVSNGNVGNDFNTSSITIQQKIGRLKALREVFFQ